MIREGLESILSSAGRPDLYEKLEEVGTDLVFCASDYRLKEEMPSDGPGLVVVTDRDVAGDILERLNLYDEDRVFTIRDESMEVVDYIRDRTKPTTVAGFGGGRVLDVAKMVAHKSEVPLISVPTAPSHDGLLSRNTSLKEDGEKKSFPTIYPVRVIIPEHLWEDSGVLQKAGKLDVIANVTSLQDVSLSGEETDEEPLSLSASAALKMIEEESGDEMAEALFLSGLAMEESSRYCSGAEHELEKLLTPHFEGDYLHGQLVGTASLLVAMIYRDRAAYLSDSLFFDPEELAEELVEIYREKELLDFAQRPVLENSLEEMAGVLGGASSVRPERHTLWNEIDSEGVDWVEHLEEMESI